MGKGGCCGQESLPGTVSLLMPPSCFARLLHFTMFFIGFRDGEIAPAPSLEGLLQLSFHGDVFDLQRIQNKHVQEFFPARQEDRGIAFVFVAVVSTLPSRSLRALQRLGRH